MNDRWIKMSEKGYWVFPTKNRFKYPTALGSQKWDAFIENKEHELLHAHLLHHNDTTGACICPQATDPVPLFIMDLDIYGEEFENLWIALSPNEAISEKAGVVRSASGGWHLWFKLPDDVSPNSIPAEVDFGGGVKGEIRVSSKARRMLMLPGSCVTNKHGSAGEYELVQDFDIDTLPDPPESLMTRVLARKKTKTPSTETDAHPTEVTHYLDILRDLPSLPEGGRNVTVAKIGQVLGRLHPAKRMPDNLFDEVWQIMTPKLGNFTQKEFSTTVLSAWKTGTKNADAYAPRDKHPSVTDVKSECESVFTAIPWLVEVRDSGGKTREWLAGFGGSAKRRHEADKIVKLKDLGDILPTLTRLTSADQNTVVRSPLFIQPGWSKALEYMLKTERAIDQMGVPPEERFWELLDEWARISAGDRLFLEGWKEKRPQGASHPFIVWPLESGQAPALVVPPMLQETLLTQIGDIPLAKRLVNRNLLQKTLVGMRSGQKVWVCPISSLEETTVEYIGAQYESYVRSKTA